MKRKELVVIRISCHTDKLSDTEAYTHTGTDTQTQAQIVAILAAATDITTVTNVTVNAVSDMVAS